MKRTFLSKIKSPKALRALIRKQNKKKFVFTNGCFDLLHKGHVTYLERARRLGDALIVAVNADDSVKRLKGSARPLNPLADRLEVIAALESVDFVTWFEDDTPVKLVQLLEPAVYVKGGDWKISSLREAPIVQSYGGKVKILPYIKGRSTTQLIARAAKT